MAHSLSAKKRDRQNAKRRLHNRGHKNALRTLGKRLAKAVAPKSEDVKGKSKASKAAAEAEAAKPLDAVAEYKAIQTKLDRMASKGVMHPNTAARRKSRLAKKVNAVKAAASAAPASA